MSWISRPPLDQGPRRRLRRRQQHAQTQTQTTTQVPCVGAGACVCLKVTNATNVAETARFQRRGVAGAQRLQPRGGRYRQCGPHAQRHRRDRRRQQYLSREHDARPSRAVGRDVQCRHPEQREMQRGFGAAVRAAARRVRRSLSDAAHAEPGQPADSDHHGRADNVLHRRIGRYRQRAAAYGHARLLHDHAIHRQRDPDPGRLFHLPQRQRL